MFWLEADMFVLFLDMKVAKQNKHMFVHYMCMCALRSKFLRLSAELLLLAQVILMKNRKTTLP